MGKRKNKTNSKSCNRESRKRIQDSPGKRTIEVPPTELRDVQGTNNRRRLSSPTGIPIPSRESPIHSSAYATGNIDTRQPTWMAYFQSKPQQYASGTPSLTVSYIDPSGWSDNLKRSDHGRTHKYPRVRRRFIRGRTVEIPIGEPDITIQQPDNMEFPKTRYCGYVDHRSRVYRLL